MKSTCPIAILLATYNSQKYIKDQIESLLHQTFKDFVCYIHDDGSNDETLDIVLNYQKKYPNKFIVLNFPKTGSSKVNFLSMLNYVSEDYVMFCDHDDIWHKDKVELSYKEIVRKEKQYPNSNILVFGDMRVVDENLNVISDSFMEYTRLNPSFVDLNNLIIQNVISGCTCIMNKSLYEVVRKCKNYDNVKMHDWWCGLVASATGVIGYINKPLLEYRQHNSNVKGAEKNRKLYEKIQTIFTLICRKEFFAKQKEWQESIRLQIMELSELDEIDENTRLFCKEYCNLKNQNKIKRVLFYLKHNIRREKDNGWMMILWV